MGRSRGTHANSLPRGPCPKGPRFGYSNFFVKLTKSDAQILSTSQIGRFSDHIFMSTNHASRTPSNSSTKSYRFDGRHLALTYSNLEQQAMGSSDAKNPYSLETFLCDLRDRLGQLDRGWVYIAASRERHADGSTHFHAGVRLERKWTFRDPRTLDVGGYHPNIQSARNFAKWITYLKKDGDYLELGELDNKQSTPRITPEELIDLARSSDQAEFLAFCSVNKYFGGKDIWNLVHEDNSLTITSDTQIEGHITDEFKTLAANFIWNPNLTLLIVGDSGIGKTTWAKQTIPKPCLFVSHIDDLRKFKVGYHVSILFDDVSILHMPETAQIHITDQENPRSIHCRYGTARIPAGTTKIFTCNSVPVDLNSAPISRRIQILFAYKADLDRVRNV